MTRSLTSRKLALLPAQPYVLTFAATGTRYPLTSEDAQRLVDAYPLVSVSARRLTLRGDDGYTATIEPAAPFGAAAFAWTR